MLNSSKTSIPVEPKVNPEPFGVQAWFSFDMIGFEISLATRCINHPEAGV